LAHDHGESYLNQKRRHPVVVSN